MNDRKLTPEQVKGAAIKIGMFLEESRMPVDTGMAALAMVLATTAKTMGLTNHDVISRFTSSVRSVYNDEQWNQ